MWTRHGGGHNGQPHDGTRRSCLVPFIDQSERLSALIDDPRIHDIAASLLGDDFNYAGSDGNYYAGDTRWHSDGWNVEGTPGVKIALYLDRVTRDTGALRVIPGSHRPGDTYADLLQEQVKESESLWGTEGSDIPAYALESRPGDIACFSHNIKHAAFGGSQRRRMFTINFFEHYPESRLDELRKLIELNARFWIDRAYGETMVQTAGPERMEHLKQFLANDGRLAELSRRKQTEMTEPSRG